MNETVRYINLSETLSNGQTQAVLTLITPCVMREGITRITPTKVIINTSINDSIVASIVDTPICANTAYRLAVAVFFPNELKCPEEYRLQPGISFHYNGVYPEVKAAQVLRRTDPLAALDILLPIARREKGIDARVECIACYYQLKDWESRIDMINDTIRHIDNLTSEDLPPNTLKSLQGYLTKLFQQLDFSQKRLESQLKKQKRL